MRDMLSEIQPIPSISPQVETGNNALVGAIVGRQGFGALTYVIVTGTLADADATFAVLLEHGDDAALSDAAEVPDAQLNGTEALAGFAFGDDDATRKIG